MAKARGISQASNANDWLFESIATSQRDNNRNLIWVCGAFLLASFLTVAFNLGAIETIAFQALSVEGEFGSVIPMRIMMAVVCFVTYAAIVYVVMEQQRLELGLEYLAKSEQSEAAQLGSFEDWLSSNYPFVSRFKRLSMFAFIIFCLAILIIDVATLVYSFSN